MPTIDDPSPARVEIRLAEPGEAEQVRALDDAVFPEISIDLERAPEGELEEATQVGDVFFLELDAERVGYIHVNRQDPRCIYVAGMGWLPEMQDRRLGTALARKVKAKLYAVTVGADRLPVYTVTSPHNFRMLRILFNLGFAGRWALPDYFGPGRHRIGCQMRRPGPK